MAPVVASVGDGHFLSVSASEINIFLVKKIQNVITDEKMCFLVGYGEGNIYRDTEYGCK